MGMLSLLVLALVVAAAPPDQAAIERQAKALEAKLIAPCCWSQQVSVHQSPAADQIKADVRRMLTEGKAPQQILESYVAQYGDRILAEPPARGFSAALYVVPWILLAGSVGLVVVVIRRLRAPDAARPAPAEQVPVNDEEAERIDEELRHLE
ncbi:MAG: cytochrome c-type biogenesis protein CcmH [Acidobacteriota bacterium]